MTDLPPSTLSARALSAVPDDLEAVEAFGLLSSLLWRERETLERLLFKLIEQQLILSAGSTRWLANADAEVAAAAEALQDHEIARAAEVALLVQRYGLPADTSLRQVALVAPEPWPVVLLEPRDALRALPLEIDAVTTENRRMLLAGEHATREALQRMANGPSRRAERPRTYGARGDVAPLRNAFLLDEQA